MPQITPFFFGGILIWFIISFLFHKNLITTLTHAKPIERSVYPKLYNIVENLCISRGLPTPKIYIINDASMNAFASGLSPKDSIIVFTQGLVNKLDDKEIEAVAAHELTHIMNRDTRLMLIAIIFVGIITTLSEILIRMRIRPKGKKAGSAVLIMLAVKLIAFIIGTFISIMIQSAISRKREFLADSGSVELTKDSKHLISALEKISQDSKVEAINNKNLAQMFIINPISETKTNVWNKLFSTHPPVAERIEILKQM